MTYNKFEDYLQSIGSNPEIIFDPNPSPEKHKVYGHNYGIIQKGVQLSIENENSTMKNGLWLEFGVYSGITINSIARIAKHREIFGFDSFLGLPEVWRGMPTDVFNRDGVTPDVESNVTLISGWFNDTIPKFLSENKSDYISFLHIDCDIYSSTTEVFNNFYDKIKKGTVILFDELYNYPEWRDHEFKALMEFTEKYDKKFDVIAYAGSSAPSNQQALIQIL
mgnify:FL=1